LSALDSSCRPGQRYFYRITVRRLDGSTAQFGPVNATFGGSVAMNTLALVGPNPTRGESQIEYGIAHGGKWRLTILAGSGRVVETLVDGPRDPGAYRASWSGQGAGKDLAAGIYFARMSVDGWEATERLVRLP